MEGVAAASVEGHSGAHDHPHRICGAASAVNAQGGATHPALVAPPPHRGRTIRSRYTVCPHSFTPSFPFCLAFGAHYEPCWPRRCTHSHGTDLEHHPSPCRTLPHHRYRNQHLAAQRLHRAPREPRLEQFEHELLRLHRELLGGKRRARHHRST